VGLIIYTKLERISWEPPMRKTLPLFLTIFCLLVTLTFWPYIAEKLQNHQFKLLSLTLKFHLCL